MASANRDALSCASRKAIELSALIQTAGKLRNDALALLSRSQLDSLLTAAWGAFAVVGSVDLDLMTWRDIDLHVCGDQSEAGRFLAFAAEFQSACSTVGLNLVKVSFNNEYARPGSVYGEGLYLGFRVVDEGVLWKIDLWAWNSATFERKRSEHEALKARLAKADRDLILRIKSAIHGRPEYRETITSMDVYEFALVAAGADVAAFDAWRAARNR